MRGRAVFFFFLEKRRERERSEEGLRFGNEDVG
jgi:hypothetical protein